ncbi:hypothetical protein NJB14197_29670 [Mycobacterium montefiorense]|uniref:Uncharacterized protein n=1 Tax=Mycobacterium montefiorense TaxID=154654 RepID=A0AA37PRX9_9MYCO|nr:hypothetical protein MmonteBS_01910 [Mycobacterium montefiorense]GKU35969.1 hypothetical protein NJB14191_33150 [Mycobacterium montefiorense]GKU41575.1 hypothetical protein NJB14192_35590 [Mycobacterium montefiorense]GKU44409.1 hypothetical protein NJB14194_10370 [Mycobacterium montefiorense]GKU51913.1 hypothetical protein NJB14195_31570 [Mycobacterium montefiorense]
MARSVLDLLELGYVPLQDSAERMGISVERVQDLVKRGVLRASSDGLYVQPAIVSGSIGPLVEDPPSCCLIHRDM